MPEPRALRPAPSEFASVIWFKALMVSAEDTLGADGAAAAFMHAGKVRGQRLAAGLDLAVHALPAEELAPLLDQTLGAGDTRLCTVVRSYQQGERLIVDTEKSVCSVGEAPGSHRKCIFTLGAVWGALQTITGKTYLGRQTQSVLRGGEYDRFEFTEF